MNDFLSLGAILQPIPEHPKRDFIFCLSTAFGDAYLFQVRVIILIWWSSIIMIMMMIITSSRWKILKMLMIVIYELLSLSQSEEPYYYFLYKYYSISSNKSVGECDTSWDWHQTSEIVK